MTDWLDIRIGDCRERLRELDAESVHCVVTSPPYWGLRDYGVEGQLGLEPTPEAYVASMVEVFREVRRVLRSDGTVWLNLGDSYAANGVSGLGIKGEASTLVGTANHAHTAQPKTVPSGLKPKDLVGIPWRVAFALQADGWYLRSDIIWSKPNPMPESVTDRPTKAHEYVFLLSKSARYYYDADAVREPHLPVTLARIEKPLHHRHPDNVGVGIPPVDTERMGERFANPAGRNMRSVWTIATQPYPGAHFATFPEALVEPCIKAGTSERGVCPECGAPWVREVERDQPPAVDPSSIDRYGTGEAGVHRKVGGQYQKWLDANPPQTTGWRPSCKCLDAAYRHPEPTPATVLDPFAGSGTTGLVANRLSRRAILIELSEDYIGQLRHRNRQTPLGLLG